MTGARRCDDVMTASQNSVVAELEALDGSPTPVATGCALPWPNVAKWRHPS